GTFRVEARLSMSSPGIAATLSRLFLTVIYNNLNLSVRLRTIRTISRTHKRSSRLSDNLHPFPKANSLRITCPRCDATIMTIGIDAVLELLPRSRLCRRSPAGDVAQRSDRVVVHGRAEAVARSVAASKRRSPTRSALEGLWR